MENNQHLTDCANFLTEINSKDFLDFLMDAIEWVHEHQMKKSDYDNSRDPHFLHTIIIKEIAIPLLCKKPSLQSDIIKGLDCIYQCADTKGFFENISSISESFGYDIATGGYPGNELMKKYTDGFGILLRIGTFLAAHECACDFENKEAA